MFKSIWNNTRHYTSVCLEQTGVVCIKGAVYTAPKQDSVRVSNMMKLLAAAALNVTANVIDKAADKM